MTAAISPPTEECGPRSSPSNVAVSESLSGASAMDWAPDIRDSPPRYSGRAVIRTINGVRGTTERNSATMDSLTTSIQCASSMITNAGVVRASDAVLIMAVRRRRRASGSITGSGTSGSATPSRSSSSNRSCGPALGIWSRSLARADELSRSSTPITARSNWVTRWNGTSRACDSQKVHTTSTPTQAGHGCSLTGHPRLTDARWSDHTHHAAAATGRPVPPWRPEPRSPNGGRPEWPRRVRPSHPPVR